jgi:oligopeptide/dipeptide ABC transporter ATP-binding protein
MTALLEATEVDLAYSRGAAPVVRGATMTLEPGATVGLVGESGCGKTSLARALVGLIPATAGSVLVKGRAWESIGRRDQLRRSVQMVFQDPYSSLNPRLTARQTVAEVFEVWGGTSRSVSLRKGGDLLSELGLASDAIDRRPRRLSGGQCQRVGIARALACDPQVLVADEPTSSLDVSVQAQILNLIRGLCAERGLALILVSHDLSVVRYMTTEALVMYRGRIVERGPTESIFTDPRHPYTRLLLDSVPGSERSVGVASNQVSDDGCVFAERCPRIQPECTVQEPPEIESGHSVVRCIAPLH